jgi:hypothetical protein
MLCVTKKSCMLIAIMLNGIMLSVIWLNVFMLRVVAPYLEHLKVPQFQGKLALAFNRLCCRL